MAGPSALLSYVSGGGAGAAGPSRPLTKAEAVAGVTSLGADLAGTVFR